AANGRKYRTIDEKAAAHEWAPVVPAERSESRDPWPPDGDHGSPLARGRPDFRGGNHALGDEVQDHPVGNGAASHLRGVATPGLPRASQGAQPRGAAQ